MELLKPNLFQEILDLLSFEVLHQVRNELNILFTSLIGIIATSPTPVVLSLATSLHHSYTGVEELPEVVTNGQVHQNLLIEGCVIVAFHSSDVFQFREVT